MRLDLFEEYLKKENIKYENSVLMSDKTTFKIGGKADVFVIPETEFEMISALKSAKNFDVPVFVLGKGSNILCSDNGIEGAVISTERLCEIKIDGERIICGSGASLYKACVYARDNSLEGLEFAYGIPGSIGGAFYMNAGAYGGEICDVAESAVCVDRNLNIITVPVSEMGLSYRTSRFKTDGLIIISVVIKLKKGNREEITAKQLDFFARRNDKQPLNYPSAGSTFKRPVGNYAGTLIEKNGLKGKSVGGAEVSEKHAGFIINKGDATAKDVLNLIEIVKETVFKNDGVELSPEVLFIGRKL